MITPPFLKKGDLIRIVAPAAKVSKEALDYSISLLQSKGYEVETGRYLFGESHSYLAGMDHERLADLQSALSQSSVRAVLCARGGYGITRIVDQINLDVLVQNPKWVVGFSDMTALHLSILKKGVKSIHGTMPKLFAEDDDQSLSSMFDCLHGRCAELVAGRNKYNIAGQASGILVGGNLSLIASCIGTPSEPDLHGKILVLEEIGEDYYKIDRMLVQLKRSGSLKGIAGMAVGYVSGKGIDTSYCATVEEIFAELATELKVPLGFGLPTGHERPNVSWVHGQQVTLNVGLTGTRITSVD